MSFDHLLPKLLTDSSPLSIYLPNFISFFFFFFFFNPSNPICVAHISQVLVLSLCYIIRHEDLKIHPPYTPSAWAPLVPSNQNPLDPLPSFFPEASRSCQLPVKWADASWINALTLNNMSRSPERKFNRKTRFLWYYQFKIQNMSHGSEQNSTGSVLGATVRRYLSLGKALYRFSAWCTPALQRNAGEEVRHQSLNIISCRVCR